jgi:hypothetical protein
MRFTAQKKDVYFHHVITVALSAGLEASGTVSYRLEQLLVCMAMMAVHLLDLARRNWQVAANTMSPVRLEL